MAEKNKDLEYIKKHYSEKFAHICRSCFPTLLETPGLLPEIIEKNFAHSASLGEDIEGTISDFQNFILSQFDAKEKKIITNKTATELLNEAEYILYPECKTEADIQSFRHYFFTTNPKAQYVEGKPIPQRDGEELCTFNGDRLDSCRVFFAVKKNVDDIKRKNFTNPQRQDEYGTSVISIQFEKSNNYLSIKNRYNHTVDNPDNTFNSNLDNIIPGLADAFKRDYNLKISNENNMFELPDWVQATDGKFYRYNFETNHIYYCENNVVIKNFVPKQYDKRMYEIVDNYIIDLKEKTIKCLDPTEKDSFLDGFQNIEKINIEKDSTGNRTFTIKQANKQDVILTVNKHNEIIALSDPNRVEIGDNFMHYNRSLQQLNLPNLHSCGNYFLCYNNALTSLNLPNLQSCGNYFLCYNNALTSLNLPNLQSCGHSFLYLNKSLTYLNLPCLQSCENTFLYYNDSLTYLNLPCLQSCGHDFLYCNNSLTYLNLPCLQSCGHDFLYCNNSLTYLNLPNLQSCGDYFLCCNNALTSLNAPNLTNYGYNILYVAKNINNINSPILENDKEFIKSHCTPTCAEKIQLKNPSSQIGLKPKDNSNETSSDSESGM